jgi:hypothetical protein
MTTESCGLMRGIQLYNWKNTSKSKTSAFRANALRREVSTNFSTKSKFYFLSIRNILVLSTLCTYTVTKTERVCCKCINTQQLFSLKGVFVANAKDRERSSHSCEVTLWELANYRVHLYYVVHFIISRLFQTIEFAHITDRRNAWEDIGSLNNEYCPRS